MKKSTNRRSFLSKGLTAAGAAAVPAMAANADKPAKKVHWVKGKRPEKTPLFSPAVSYGNLLYLSGIGAHFKGDIKQHTEHVLNQLKERLEEAGSSMEKVLKVNVYLNDLKDYAGMNEVFLGKFGPEPPVRTTIAAAGGIPGDSLVEIDCIAYI
ncbi:MAG TPA: RidA family protein [Bryobacteraceae bacterium]|jgi:enamine deaminase RidA (YjgF/YER057c/UK114 family)|nr:RidA family protein [Bryobacteraceae bacterium]